MMRACAFSGPQLPGMDSESEALLKEYSKMMADMMVLCATLALSLFFWMVSLAISTYSGEQLPPAIGPSLRWLGLLLNCILVLCAKECCVRRAALFPAELMNICAPVS